MDVYYSGSFHKQYLLIYDFKYDFEQASACLKHIQYIKFLLYTSQHSSVINKTMICMPECKIYLTSVKNVINYKI